MNPRKFLCGGSLHGPIIRRRGLVSSRRPPGIESPRICIRLSDVRVGCRDVQGRCFSLSASAHPLTTAAQPPTAAQQGHSRGTAAAQKIAQKWLDASALTATNKDFEGHFDLISKKVRVTGVPGFESISYDDWARASEKDFKEGVLDSVSYEGLKMNAHNDTQIMFKTLESINVNDGSKKTQGVEILIELEEDGVWRVIQERVMTGDEIRHVGLM